MRQNTGQPAIHPKTVLRRTLRAGRNSLPSAQRAGHDEAIAQHLLQLVRSSGAKSIAGYWPFNGEPDITPLYGQLLAEGCRLALPVVSTDARNDMQFHSWHPESTVIENRYGIFEPSNTEQVPLSGLDMLIIPLVGYDRSGNRLGMGSGYYDRCLESLHDSPAPLRVGVAYSLQEIDHLETDKWDVPLHGIVNENGWFACDGMQPLTKFTED